MVLVRLLGPVDLVDGAGTVRSPASDLRRTLLALLAMRAGAVVSSDWLLEHAWGGEPPESGLRALRFHISRLRKELGGNGLIETRPGGYRLAVSSDEVDALAVEGRARAAKREPDRGVAVHLYSELLAMWRGPPFVDVAPCATLDDEAGRLEALRLAITEDQFQARLDAGGDRELVADLTRAAAQHPLREAMWTMLVTAQYRAGLQADALRTYEQLRMMMAETLGLDPSPELHDLQRRVLQHDPSLLGGTYLGRGARQGNLPAPATALIDGDGRLELARSLLEDHRLVTLTGTGGIGKTRLAVELGWSCVDDFDDGVWMVELAPVSNADALDAAVASALGIRSQQNSTLIESIVDWFVGRDLLLIIDNCEHVLASVGRLLRVLLNRCPTVKIIATSREPLGLAGERVHRIDVLNPASDGVALFVDRATASDSSFVLRNDELDTVREICARLDGLPLAIELAAARIRSMAPVDLVRRLDDRFKLLRGGFDHHETLQMTVEWSYHLLSEDERVLFDRLSVFAGGFGLRAAEAVCTADTIDEPDVVDLMRNLVDKSMILAERHLQGTRYRMLETLRQFAEHRLEEGDSAPTLRERHLHHYVTVAEEADTLFRGAEQVTGAEMFEREWDNLRRAHEWAITTANLPMAERLIAALKLHAHRRLRYELGDWVERTIALGTEDRQPTPDTFAHGAFWAFSREDHERGRELLDRGFELVVEIDDPSALGCVGMTSIHSHPRVADPFRALRDVAANLDLDREWWVLGALADLALPPEPPTDVDHLARLVEAAERIHCPQLQIAAALETGKWSVLQSPPDLAAALDLYPAALAIARESGDLVSESDCRRAVAFATVGLHLHNELEVCRAALACLYEIRYWFRIWHLFDSVALAMASTGRLEAASVSLGCLDAHHPPFGIEQDLRFRDQAHDIVGRKPQVEEWMARGAAMDRHQIVEYALAELDRAQASMSRTSGATRVP